MIGKKTVILTLLVILVIQIVSPINLVNAQVISTCNANLDTSTVGAFVTDALGDGLALLASNSVTSFLSGLPLVGGAFEPTEEATDFLFRWWMLALLFGGLGSLAVYLAGGLVNYALVLNANLTIHNVVLDTGYGIILNLVNLGFVAAIVVMAFATMFRRSSWDAKSSLVKLIIAVLLINFSIFFAGIILNISTELTKVLISNGCADSLANHFNIMTINDSVDKFLKSGASNFLEKGLLSIMSIFFASLLTIIGAITLFGIFLFLIARYIAVMVLLIFMPIIWLGFIFPQLQLPGIGTAWSGWWKQFLKWIFNGPIMAFFLYLTIILVNNIGPNSQLTVPGAGPVQVIAQMLVVVALSLAGLYTANKLGITGAAFLYGGVAKIGGMGLAGLKATGISIASAPLKTKTAERVMGWMARGKMTIPGTKIRIPTGTKEIGRLGIQAEAYARKQAEAGAKRYDGLTAKQKNQLLPGLTRYGADYARLLENLLKDGDLDMDIAKQELSRARTKPNLEWSKHEKLYNDLEKFAVNTSKSIEETAKENMLETSKATAELFGKVKDNEWGKKLKLNNIFEDIKMDKYKNKDGTYNMASYDKEVKQNKWDRERIVRAIALHPPEKLIKAFKSLSAGEQRINFIKTNQESQHGSMDSKFNRIDFTFNQVPKRTQEYYIATPAPIKKKGLISPVEKLFKNVYEESPKDTIERAEFEEKTKKDES